MKTERILAMLLGREHLEPQRVVAESERLQKVGSAREAQAFIPFPIREPATLGQADVIAATPPGAGPADHAAVMFRFENTPHGSVTVLQQSGAEVVTIRGWIPALLEVSPHGSVIRWVEGGVVFTVVAQSATREQMLELAEKI